MSKSESEQLLLGWKQIFPSVWIRVHLGSCRKSYVMSEKPSIRFVFLGSTALPALIPIFLPPDFICPREAEWGII